MIIRTNSPTIQRTCDTATMQRTYNPSTSRDDRIAIQTALIFKVPYTKIQEVLGVTRHQIQYARIHPTTPQKSKCGDRPLIRTPQRRALERWLQLSPSHRRIPY